MSVLVPCRLYSNSVADFAAQVPRRMATAERLHARLLVDADHRRSSWRAHVERANAAGLLLELLIRAVQPHPHMVRPNPFTAQDPAELAGAESPPRLSLHRILQRPEGPEIAEGNLLRPVARELDDRAPDLDGNPRRTSATRRVLERNQLRLVLDTLAPLPNRLSRHLEPPRNLGVAHAEARHADHLRARHQPMRLRCRPSQLLQRLSQLPRELEWRRRRSRHRHLSCQLRPGMESIWPALAAFRSDKVRSQTTQPHHPDTNFGDAVLVGGATSGFALPK